MSGGYWRRVSAVDGIYEARVHTRTGWGEGWREDGSRVKVATGYADYVLARTLGQPPDTTTVHALLVEDGEVSPRTLCCWWGGTWRHELTGRERLCAECLAGLGSVACGQAVSARYDQLADMDRRCTELLTRREVWADVTYRADGCAHVRLSHPAPLLVGLVKETRGRHWDQDRRVWVVPAERAEQLAHRLARAGVEVNTDRADLDEANARMDAAWAATLDLAALAAGVAAVLDAA